MANPFGYLELHSTDVPRAKRFYTELFGWSAKDTPVPKIGTYTEIGTGEGPPAGLMTQQEPGARSSWLPYVTVSKLDETVTRRRSSAPP
jgi:predicted enzyme related to lactoylglutathione lyase